MNAKKLILQAVRVLFPFVLGGTILWWMYRGEDLHGIRRVLTEEMNWTWMLLSLPFGVLAQVLRSWRWKQTLEPVLERNSWNVECGMWNENTSATDSALEGNLIPHSTFHIPQGDPHSTFHIPRIRTSVCVYAVFLSYLSSMVIPRSGEFSRCGVLKRYDGVSFSKALGTVVTERAVDTLMVMLYSGVILLLQLSVFGTFFKKTGMSPEGILQGFSLTGWIVTLVCAVAVAGLLHLLLKNLSIYNKVKTTLGGIWEGVVSLRSVSNLPLYLLFSVGIWVSYFLHFYLTFFCFGFTAGLGIGCALVTFVVSNFAALVPTPNGAGPWHFAIKTMLILYGVADEQALWFVLIVHTIQTLLVVALGVYGWLALSLTRIYSRAESQSTQS